MKEITVTCQRPSSYLANITMLVNVNIFIFVTDLDAYSHTGYRTPAEDAMLDHTARLLMIELVLKQRPIL